MNRITFFIDGFNLFHSLDDVPEYHKYKWLDLSKLAKKFVTQKDTIKDILYFTALTTWNLEKTQRHQLYIKALELNNVKVIYGKFRKKYPKCPLCHKKYTTHEEKRTDVNIAIHLFELAFKDEYDTAAVITGDSDLIPSIKAVSSIFTSKTIWLIIPIGRDAKELINCCDKHMRIKEKHLQSSLFPPEIKLNDTNKLICPPRWK